MTECPGCGREFDEGAIRRASSFAVCPSCGRITDLEHRPPAAAPAEGPAPAALPLPVPPPGVTVLRAGGRIEIRIPWSRIISRGEGAWVASISAVFLLVWIWRPGALLAVLGLRRVVEGDKEIGLLQMIVGGLALVSFIAWQYACLNVTTIIAEKGTVRSSSGPLPCPGSTCVEVPGALRFTTKEILVTPQTRHVRAARALGSSRLEDSMHRHSVYAEFEDGRIVEVVGRLFRPEEATFVAAALEVHLGARQPPY